MLDLSNLEVCKTRFQKFKGLMFSKKKNLLFVLDKEERFSAGIHMLFVFYPIKVIWLDSKFKIVDLAKLRPFIGFHVPMKKARYILEISVKPSTKSKEEFKIGEVLDLERFLR